MKPFTIFIALVLVFTTTSCATHGLIGPGNITLKQKDPFAQRGCTCQTTSTHQYHPVHK